MALKDEASRLMTQTYPLRLTIRVLYNDMDGFRHFNNGATGRYFEEARANLNMWIFGPDCMIHPQDRLQILRANVVIDYLGQAHYPGQVQIATGLKPSAQAPMSSPRRRSGAVNASPSAKR